MGRSFRSLVTRFARPSILRAMRSTPRWRPNAVCSVKRVMSTAHGGQVLLSNVSAELVRGQLPESVTLRDMGEHRLKGIVSAEHLWQVVAPDLPQDFPPLQSLQTIPNNLPIQVTSFVGREKEIVEVKQLLTEDGGRTMEEDAHRS